VSRVVHLVVDWSAEDRQAVRDVVRGVTLAVPGAMVHLHRVEPGDSLGAGCCVAHLMLTGDEPPRMVAHDVADRGGEPLEHWCAGRGRAGTLVMGTPVGWAWSFVLESLEAGPCVLDVPVRREDDPRHQRLVSAIRHLATGHPHAVAGTVPPEDLPALPERAIAWADPRGNLKTTMSSLPAPVGEHLRVSIGPVSETALVSDGVVRARPGELALAPTPVGVELTLSGGSASRRFGSPRSGTPVSLARS
jgi:hypothetical protein